MNMKIQSLLFLSFVLYVTAPGGVTAAVNNQIVVNLEEPVSQGIYSGVANIRGWAVAPIAINRVELYIDGAWKTNVPSGAMRLDVGSAYPGYPNSSQSGFSMAFNYSNLSVGAHNMSVRAIDVNDNYRDTGAAFNVARFEISFMPDPNSVNLENAQITHDGQWLSIQNMTANGKTYNLRLDWTPATQGFELTQIVQASTSPPSDDFSGTYIGEKFLVSNNCDWLDSSDLPSGGSDLYVLEQTGNQLSGIVYSSDEEFDLTGTVEPDGDFVFTIPMGSTSEGGCGLELYAADKGNFVQENLDETIFINVFGSCPSGVTSCSIRYQGTISNSSP